MKIDYVLYQQAKLQDEMGNPMRSLVPESDDHAIKENMLALIVEATEVLNEINWKPWRRVNKVTSRDKLLTELIDVLQFWANAINEAGFTEADVLRAYDEKLSVCYGRAMLARKNGDGC